MNYLPPHSRHSDPMRDIDLVLDGYTVSSRGRCMTRIGMKVVMRDSAHRCVRVDMATTNPESLRAMWEVFTRETNEVVDTSDRHATALHGPDCPSEVSVVVEGYTANQHGVRLARVVGQYVTRDGARRQTKFLVDTVDPAKLVEAWAVLGDAAGWARATLGPRLEILNESVDPRPDASERRRAFG